MIKKFATAFTFTLPFQTLLLAGLVISAPVPATARWQQARDSNLNFWIYVPNQNAPSRRASRFGDQRLGLVLNLHGCTQKAAALKDHGNWQKAADEHGFVVVIPDVPNGGVYAGCWDYYGADHSASNRHSGPVISLTQNLLKKPELRIDPARVYVSGLSSGAGQALVLGCLRPDLYRGVALAAAPALGTGASDLQLPRTNADEVARLCRLLAAEHAPALASQVASIILGDRDPIVNTNHSSINAEALAALYGATSQSPLDLSKFKGANTRGRGFVLRDSAGLPRLAFIVNEGLGHAWPAGNGGSDRAPSMTSFINSKSLDYPDFLGRFFTQAGRLQLARSRARRP